MAAMEELSTQLQSLQALKPPGVTPTKIKTITQICVDNIQSEHLIIQRIVQQFQNSAATHKLGVIYVVDAVARQWLEKAKASGQAVSKSAASGTFASGVQLIRDVLPVLMTNLAQSAPDSQREKISKLLDIWQRGQTFPSDMLATFKQLLNGGQSNVQSAPATLSNGNAVAQAFGGQTNQQPPPPHVQTQIPQIAGAQFAALASLNQQVASTNAPPAAPSFPFLQGGPPPPPPGFVPPPPAASTAQSALPPPPAGMSELAGQILQAMSVGSIAPEQAIQVLNALAAAQTGGAALPPAPPQPMTLPPPLPQVQPVVQNVSQLERYDQHDTRMRDRSRSPDYQRNRSPLRKSPPNPNRRESPTYGVYDPNAGPDGNALRFEPGERGRSRGKQRGGRNDRNEYRQRSPPRRQPSPPRAAHGQSKYIEWDDTLPRDHIRVLSRTLFVGGAGGTESEIRSIFSRFGRVQTCIVNQEKRHAFVKMMTRPDAVAAKEGMDSLQDPVAQTKARQTRWGVGFGPRDCSDYQSGISVIPIFRLTDADRKWALNAEHGGTGGRMLEGGMVIEEPDIEIGAGVSSKAISRRVAADAPRGGRGGFGGRGDFNSRGELHNAGRGGLDQGPPKFRKQDHRPVNDPRHISPRPDQGVMVPPAVPGFGFQLPGF
ncbi:hypothetical protein IAQ61_008055 [Plenodomus lingam]|uniref:RNA binding protein Nrd1 n=1 Tax=Leptosphaeria maculans (strain JN3 / isolate v23.1.3 / race Av1-4-5-6-7-8) TaxID=985895 RepID=E5A0D8_LEPMJ|nr:hypothetical protein LEMA_P101290.1 [Plenodomus lingam JN3]KAH9867461.1 hypothetical protein IAQ61_008055 [Plenodomus lingam]CBX96998.1 hypothetical protein LEMA_P101290.1 [Plenodomus lingam JN3]